MQEETNVEGSALRQVLINPIDGLAVDEIVKQREAKERGYLEPEFYLKYLEDENEFVKLFVVKGKRILMDVEKPQFQYNKPLMLDRERIHTKEEVPKACSIDDPSCEMCSG